MTPKGAVERAIAEADFLLTGDCGDFVLRRRKTRDTSPILGEFQELGFFYETTIKAGVDEHAFIDGLLYEVIEPNGLGFGGWVGGGAVSKLHRGSVSADERQVVLNWLVGRPEVMSLSATGLVDMWHGVTDTHLLS